MKFKSKIFLLALVICAYCCSSEQEDMVGTEKFRLWRACPISTIDDGKVHLKWGPVMERGPYCPTCPKDVDADIIEIYFSENEMSNFRKVIELKNGGDYSYVVDRLQNSKSYFFYLVSKKKGFVSLISDTIMAVPNKRKGFEILQTSDPEHTPRLSSVSIALQKNKIVYVDHYYTYSCPQWGTCMSTVIFMSNTDGSERELITNNTDGFPHSNGYNPRWSPTNDKIVFHFDGISNVGWIPAQIAMYDFDTECITRLTEDNNYNYSPVFSKSGEYLLYQSSKNTLATYETDIWFMNLKTLESFQITDVSKTSLRTVERPNWIDNDRFLFHGIYHGEKYQLFESSVSNKQITKVIESKWNDYTPSVSPDQTKIAFVSNRSRIPQIWIYHVVNKTYIQLTGYIDTEESVNPNNHIEWLDNSTIMFSLGSSQGFQLVKQKIE